MLISDGIWPALADIQSGKAVPIPSQHFELSLMAFGAVIARTAKRKVAQGAWA